eukprot:CAMPEP_0168403038 /NCGR_PEP_ID=MMETSP0228-20121227/23924_1 /TAXON_ID=133427 /ORGANISM="Protoceratium reticulatum, Strain CCCM 535 (=CCMP 1889)" /LENGTH=225 /DNA_ID=CAMNT_0008416631 /DNA_START=100 /DNA_END=774 /DNA_ORIENTATION=-
MLPGATRSAVQARNAAFLALLLLGPVVEPRLLVLLLLLLLGRLAELPAYGRDAQSRRRGAGQGADEVDPQPTQRWLRLVLGEQLVPLLVFLRLHLRVRVGAAAPAAVVHLLCRVVLDIVGPALQQLVDVVPLRNQPAHHKQEQAEREEDAQEPRGRHVRRALRRVDGEAEGDSGQEPRAEHARGPQGEVLVAERAPGGKGVALQRPVLGDGLEFVHCLFRGTSRQ